MNASAFCYWSTVLSSIFLRSQQLNKSFVWFVASMCYGRTIDQGKFEVVISGSEHRSLMTLEAK
jgi:hypothetical protein